MAIAQHNVSTQLQPGIYVKGDIYAIDIPKATSVRTYGGKVQLIQVEMLRSTTVNI